MLFTLKKISGASFLLFVLTTFAHAQPAPAPYGALPSARQLTLHEMEMYALIHFTPTTYENKEWGFGDANPLIFNPTKFDANQIAAAIKAGGFKGFTVVAKHHDGFCLWPTKTTAYNISKSPFRNGKGDMVKEFADAARKNGLQLGIYCSPWDRNNTNYGSPEYVTNVYYPQLKELYSRYGKLFTVFYDGANGGDGYYGGTREKRKIDAVTYYNFDKIWEMVRSMQPTANIFSDVGPDVRWVGNERGMAAETSWATLTPTPPDNSSLPAAPGFADSKILTTGTRNGKYWIPAECDVPMRPGWFYHPEDEEKVKTAKQLLDIYYTSVGRGGVMDLGVSPTTDGLLSNGDVKKLNEFGALLKQTFAVNLAKGAIVKASNTRAGSTKFSAQLLTDNDRYSYWATDDSVTTPDVVITLSKTTRFNVIRLRENIKLGQRIEEVAIDMWEQNKWVQIATATSVGANRLIRLPQYVRAQKLRLRIEKSPVCIALSDFGLFAEPESLLQATNTTTKKEISKTAWKVAEGFEQAIDNNPASIYTSAEGMPQSIIIDMFTDQSFSSFIYQPRTDGKKEGIADQYSFYISKDGKLWELAVAGEFSNIVNNPIEQSVPVGKTLKARFIKFEAKRVVEGNRLTIAEVGVR
ncbi:alpha-L-fucosidase [Lacibacter sediminis]|uniref:alpha-L-fucosidase n=1 Tax=Lacibacter sediminis TaxID=2760713 RepID=A0A7G5XE61_9BACT|nr:alpha-L-fucosidase [Lacibacter sediminis]QNA43764.1 alpha-L-fucosidase [Lacibacter sediminis]